MVHLQAAAQTLVDVQAHVSALQHPAKAQQAARWLEQFQRSEGVVPFCAELLKGALVAQEATTAFFAAQTIAQNSRCLVTDPVAWTSLAKEILSILKAAALQQVSLPMPVLRQLVTAVVRLVLVLGDEWPGSLDELLAIPDGPDPRPQIACLRALADDSVQDRRIASPSKRVDMATQLRSRTRDIMQALERVISASPAIVLQVAAAWLRAQLDFEACLPMIRFRTGTHSNLCSIVPLVPWAVRGARLEFDLDCLKAAFEVFETALALTTDLSKGQAADVIMPLLSAFASACGKLPSADEHIATRLPELTDVYSVLISVVHASLTSIAILNCHALWPGVLGMAMKVLGSVGFRSAQMQVNDGTLLHSALDMFEDFAARYYEAHDEGLLADIGGSNLAMASAFAQVLAGLPLAMALPADLHALPKEWDLNQLRSKASRVLLIWSGREDAYLEALLQQLQLMLQGVSLSFEDLSTRWADLEMAMWFAASVAQAVYRSSVLSGARPMPEMLARLFTNLPQLPRDGVLPSRMALVSAAAANLICALDPWITPELCPVNSRSTHILLDFMFNMVESPHAHSCTVDAVAVVMRNLAPALVEDANVGYQVFQRVATLCLSPSLQVDRREHLVKAALGPFLSLLPEEQLQMFLHQLAGMLCASISLDSSTPGSNLLVLFAAIAAPQSSSVEPQLKCFLTNWQWFQAALTKWAGSERIVEAVCAALVAILARSQSCQGLSEILSQVVPLLTHAATQYRSAASISTLSTLCCLFHGGPNAPLLAQHTCEMLDLLLRGGETQMLQLPSDVKAAISELLSSILAPGCAALAVLLLQQKCALAAAFVAIATMLPGLTCPQTACWNLRAFASLSHWLQHSESQALAVQVLHAVLPSLASAWCRFIMSSPVIQEPEVLTSLARAVLSIARVAPEPVTCAAGKALLDMEVRTDDQEAFLIQLMNPASTTEEVFASVLLETTQAWQQPGFLAVATVARHK